MMFKKVTIPVLFAAIGLCGVTSAAIGASREAARTSPLDSDQAYPLLTTAELDWPLDSKLSADGTSYQGWSGALADKGGCMSPRLDLSGTERPVLQFLSDNFETTSGNFDAISYSEDGETFIPLSNLLSQIILPRTAIYIKLHMAPSSTLPAPARINICDMPRGGSHEIREITGVALSTDANGNPWPVYANGKAYIDYCYDLTGLPRFFRSLTFPREHDEGHVLLRVEKAYVQTDNKTFAIDISGTPRRYSTVLPADAAAVYIRYSRQESNYPDWMTDYENPEEEGAFPEDYIPFPPQVAWFKDWCYSPYGFIYTGIGVPTDKSAWFDFSGNGSLDFGPGPNGIFSLTEDSQGAGKISTFSDITSECKTLDFNNDGNVDIISTSGLFSGTGNLDFENITPEAELRNAFPDLWEYQPFAVLEKFTPVDYNSDGLTDFIYTDQCADNIAADQRVVMVSHPDGKVGVELIHVYTPDEWAGIRSETNLFSGPSNPLDMSGWVVSSASQSSADPQFENVDLNGDGLSDLVDTSTGLFLMNTGKGSFVMSSLGGQLSLRDFNADGLIDYTSYSKTDQTLSIALSQPGSTHKISTLMSNLSLGNVWTRDFDHDGDVDILVATEFWANYNRGYSYLVYFENKGNGTFRRTETSLDGILSFNDCLDIDADGCYEAVAIRQGEFPDRNNVVAYRINRDGKVQTSPILLDADNSDAQYQIDAIMVADLHHNGRMQLIVDNRGLDSGCITDIAGATNTAPARPAAPTLFFDPTSSMLKVSWTTATDAESPSADLTYAMRAGTSPGSDNMFSADALPTGVRRNLNPGNCGYSLSRSFDVSSWPDGTYYFAVQAIDPECNGSQFSTDAVFEKKTPACDFAVELQASPAVCEEITLRRTSADLASGSYDWDLDGAEIIDSEANGRVCHIRFTTPGEKTVTLTATASNGLRHTSSRTIQVEPLRTLPASWKTLKTAIDLDEDGNHEIIDWTYGLMANDGSGKFTRVRNLFNETTEWPRMLFPADINRDGMADLVGLTYNTLFTLVNEGGLSMQVSNGFYYDDRDSFRMMTDIDNDGTYEMFTNDGIIKFSDNYTSRTHTPIEQSGLPGIPACQGDYDGDGLIDFIVSTGEETFGVYRNNGDLTFSKIKEFRNYGGQDFVMADFDGDGMTDILTTDYEAFGAYVKRSEYAYIFWGDGDFTSVQCAAGAPFDKSSAVFDFDNNGCLDVVMTDNLISFLPGHRAEVTRTMDIDSSLKETTSVFRIADGLFGSDCKLIRCANNSAPTPPSDLRHGQSDSGTVIEWSRGSDAETPAKGLTYNLSIKRRGSDGEGAYIFSPLNSNDANVALPAGMRLLTSPCITIPHGGIPAGEYEVRVQTVDGMLLQSEFSEPMLMSIAETAAITAPASTMVGRTEELKLLANHNVANLDLGAGAVIESTSGKSMRVHWTSEGEKVISADGKELCRILVYPCIDADFELPEVVLLGSVATVPASPDFLETWSLSDPASAHISSGNACSLIRFDREGAFTLERTLTAPYGSTTARCGLEVTAAGAMPALTSVTCNDSGGHYRLTWATPESDAVTGINIYKETSRLNEFELLSTLRADATEFTDELSDPSARAARYRIAYALTYGESAMSEAHQPIHVMINLGAADAINLMWSKYEGRGVTSYRILRGTSPDNLMLIAEVSGHMSSYSDRNRQPGHDYYAVEILHGPQRHKMAAAYASAETTASRSNVVCTTDACPVNAATAIAISSASGTFAIDGSTGMTLQLSACVTPATATYTRVNWYVSEGSDIVSVNSRGLITALTEGTARVTAMAVDGSDTSATVTVTVTGMPEPPVPVTGIRLNTTSLTLTEGETAVIQATVLPENATDRTIFWTSSDNNIATVGDDGTVTAISSGTASITATCAGVSANCTVTVSPQSGVTEAETSPARFNVYNLQGTLLKRDCDASVLHTLTGGTYILVYPGRTVKITI